MSQKSKWRSVRKKVLGWMIIESVPVLNRYRCSIVWPYSLEELRQFPPGTLGAELATFLDARHLNFLPQYETHDAIHLLLDYNTTVTGELRLQAFMLGNRSASLAGRVLLVLGLILLPELWHQLKQDFLRGRKSTRIAEWNISGLLRTSKETLTSRIAKVQT